MMKTLTDEQRRFAETHHDLVYAFLRRNCLPENQYYDVVIFGYLCAVQKYCENPNLHKYRFSTIAWRKMLDELKNDYKHMSKDIFSYGTVCLQDIPMVQENVAGQQDELMTQLETELLLHELAAKLPSKEMRIIHMKLAGAKMHDIAKAERISFHDIKRLLAGSYETIVQVLLG